MANKVIVNDLSRKRGILSSSLSTFQKMQSSPPEKVISLFMQNFVNALKLLFFFSSYSDLILDGIAVKKDKSTWKPESSLWEKSKPFCTLKRETPL